MKKRFLLSCCLFILFMLWTATVCLIDVKPIGPNGSEVGLAFLNNFVHELTGVNMTLYVITDWLGLVPIFVCFCFATLGLIQLIKRRSLLKVDGNILALSLFYIIVIGVYILFEYVPINYRPVLIEGILEMSYPSSTTLLVLCVMPTTIINLKYYIRNKKIKNILSYLIICFIIFMVVGRVISGVHWISDIIGAIIFSLSIDTFYNNICKLVNKQNN